MYMQIPQLPETPLPSCPRCGKPSLVKCMNEDVYWCLNCTFRKNLNRSYSDGSGLGGAIALAAIVAISFSLMSAETSVNQYRDSQPPSSKTRNNIIQTEGDRPAPPKTAKPIM
jgi:hypothetical protein